MVVLVSQYGSKILGRWGFDKILSVKSSAKIPPGK